MTDTSGNDSDASSTSRKSQRSADAKKSDSTKRANPAEVKQVDTSSEDSKTSKTKLDASMETFKRDAGTNSESKVEKLEEPPTKMQRLNAKQYAEKSEPSDGEIAKACEEKVNKTEEKSAPSEVAVREIDQEVRPTAVEGKNTTSARNNAQPEKSEISTTSKRTILHAKDADDKNTLKQNVTARKSLRAKAHVEDKKMTPQKKDEQTVSGTNLPSQGSAQRKSANVHTSINHKSSNEKLQVAVKVQKTKEIESTQPPTKKLKVSPTKSPGSTVLTFAEWLKTQEKEKEAKQHSEEDAKNALPSEIPIEITTETVNNAKDASLGTKESADKSLTKDLADAADKPKATELSSSARKRNRKQMKSEIELLKESMPKTMRDDGFVLLTKETRLRDVKKVADHIGAPKKTLPASPTKADTSRNSTVNVANRTKVIIKGSAELLEASPRSAEKLDVCSSVQNSGFKVPLAPEKSTPDNKAKQQGKKMPILKPTKLTKFKMRKCIVRLNRSIVAKFLRNLTEKHSKIQVAGHQMALAKSKIIAGPANVLTIPSSHRKAPQLPAENMSTSVNVTVSLEGSMLCEDLDNNLLTPMKSTVLNTKIAAGRRQVSQKRAVQQQQNAKGKRPTTTRTATQSVPPPATILVQSDVGPPIPVLPTPTTTSSEPETAYTPIEPKQEFEDSVTTDGHAGNILAANELYQRQLADAATMGLAPPALDAIGTHLYSFLHPAIYNRSHSVVSLDNCCPNLDGPMKAIDPTRIHAQVQAAVREVPAFVVLTTKFITRADLKNIPEHVRQKIEKQTASTMFASTSSGSPLESNNVSALQKNLPRTAIVGRTTRSQANPTPPSMDNIPPPPPLTPFSALRGNVSTVPAVISNQRFAIRSQMRRIDNNLKKLCQDYDILSFVDRQRIVEQITSTTQLLPRDFENMALVLQEYIAAQDLLKESGATESTVAPVCAGPTQQQQLQVPSTRSTRKGNQKPIYENNRIIGYVKMNASTTALTQSTMSTRTEIMSTSIDGSGTSNYSSISTSATSSVSTCKQPIQNSPRIFYTNPSMQTSTPVQTTTLANVNTPVTTPIYRRNTPRMGAGITIQQLNSSTSTSAKAKLPALTRNPHLAAASSPAVTPTITESSVTITSTTKRITRKTAAAAAGNVIVVMDSSGMTQSLDEECILPDDNSGNCAQIKHENIDEDFIGGN